MGNLIADAQAWRGGTQIAFMNPGGIRASIEYSSYPHDITWGDFFIVQPFDNKLVTMELTGSQIYALLEQQFKPPQSSMKLLQQSGLIYSFDLSQPQGARITSLSLSDGTPILPDETPYTVTCNEFIATGGDGFSVFLGGTNVTRIGVSDLDALIEYVQYLYGVPPNNTPIDPAVYPAIDGRITNVTP
jgi:5'-nucleotidase